MAEYDVMSLWWFVCFKILHFDQSAYRHNISAKFEN